MAQFKIRGIIAEDTFQQPRSQGCISCYPACSPGPFPLSFSFDYGPAFEPQTNTNRQQRRLESLALSRPSIPL